MTRIVDWRRAEDPRDVVHQAVQELTEGNLLVVPTDTCYVVLAGAMHAGSVRKLVQWTGGAGSRLSLVPRSAVETLDYFPGFAGGGYRLARKVWPGPLVIEQDVQLGRGGVLECLPSAVFKEMSGDGRIRTWLPGHEILSYILRLHSGPLVLGMPKSADRVGGRQGVQQGDATRMGVVTHVGQLPVDPTVLAIDAGVIEGIGAPTVVGVRGSQGLLMEEGVISLEQLQTLSRYLVLFVCTGNTCRSPMAAALMQKKINERFGVGDEVPVMVSSAGVSAFGGDPASQGARQAIRGYGMDLEQHRSTQLHSYLIEQADLILVMGGRHRSVIASQWPEYAQKVHLISTDGRDVADPFGGSLELYQQCARELDQYTTQWVDQLDAFSVIRWDSHV